MRALVFHAPHDLRLEELPERPLAAGEVRVAVRFGGVCGTDLRIYNGTKVIAGPRVIGHEFVGRVAEVGPHVCGIEQDARVTVYPVISCGHCHACRADRRNICVNRKTIGYELDGGFAEWVIVPAGAVAAGNIVAVPDSVDDREAAASEPVAAALQGIVRSGLRDGETVLVLGGGPIGLAHAQLARLRGAGRVVVSEPLAQRRERALQHGASDVIDPGRGPLAEQLEQLLGAGEGPDVAFVDVGIPALVEQAALALRKGGRCVIFAGMPPQNSVVLDPNLIHYREIDLRGSSGSTPQLQLAVLEHANRGELDLGQLVSDIVPLSQWEQAFGMKSDGAGLKVLLDISR